MFDTPKRISVLGWKVRSPILASAVKLIGLPISAKVTGSICSRKALPPGGLTVANSWPRLLKAKPVIPPELFGVPTTVPAPVD